MAGYVKLHRSIWRDPDFKHLGQDAAFLYLMLISQPDISHCGVLPLRPQGWAGMVDAVSVRTVRTALARLSDCGFVVIDEMENELWVRSYLVYDEAYKVPNGAKAVVAAFHKVHSPILRTHIGTLLERVGVTLETRVSSTVSATIGAPQRASEPASHSTSNPASQRATTGHADGLGDPLSNVAAAALEILVQHKVTQVDPRNPVRYAKKLRENLPIEHRTAIFGWLQRNPESTAWELAHHLDPTLPEHPPEPPLYVDPNCPICERSRIQNLAPEGAPAVYGDCPCLRSEPYPEALATVTDIRAAV